MQFQEVTPISREQALTAFASNKVEAICDALIRITYHDPDWRWVQEQCVSFAEFPDVDVRGLAVTCLGHLARIHRRLNLKEVLPMLKSLLNNPDIAPRVADTLDDIKMFMATDLSKEVKEDH